MSITVQETTRQLFHGSDAVIVEMSNRSEHDLLLDFSSSLFMEAADQHEDLIGLICEIFSGDKHAQSLGVLYVTPSVNFGLRVVVDWNIDDEPYPEIDWESADPPEDCDGLEEKQLKMLLCKFRELLRHHKMMPDEVKQACINL